MVHCSPTGHGRIILEAGLLDRFQRLIH
jgi:hypothetical protein